MSVSPRFEYLRNHKYQHWLCAHLPLGLELHRSYFQQETKGYQLQDERNKVADKLALLNNDTDYNKIIRKAMKPDYSQLKLIEVQPLIDPLDHPNLLVIYLWQYDLHH